MTATARLCFSLLSSLPLLVSWGCAAVHPQFDYDRAVQQIVQATGQEMVYRPDNDDAVVTFVGERHALEKYVLALTQGRISPWASLSEVKE